MKATIDLNGDAGEDPAAVADGREAAFLESLTSASVACGGHAGDDASMRAMATLCRERGVALGAHPAYPDRASFGRRTLDLSPAELETAVFDQIRSLALRSEQPGSTWEVGVHSAQPNWPSSCDVLQVIDEYVQTLAAEGAVEEEH